MAQEIIPEHDYHKFKMVEKRTRYDHNLGMDVIDTDELILVRGGKRAYLWTGDNVHSDPIRVYCGPKTLRALAKAILKEIPAK